jgi:hypothetical protein
MNLLGMDTLQLVATCNPSLATKSFEKYSKRKRGKRQRKRSDCEIKTGTNIFKQQEGHHQSST